MGQGHFFSVIVTILTVGLWFACGNEIETASSTEQIENVSVSSTTTATMPPLTTSTIGTTTSTEIVQDMCPCVQREYCPQLFQMSKEVRTRLNLFKLCD